MGCVLGSGIKQTFVKNGNHASAQKQASSRETGEIVTDMLLLFPECSSHSILLNNCLFLWKTAPHLRGLTKKFISHWPEVLSVEFGSLASVVQEFRLVDYHLQHVASEVALGIGRNPADSGRASVGNRAVFLAQAWQGLTLFSSLSFHWLEDCHVTLFTSKSNWEI